MGYVFISYSSKDRDIALRLAQDLKTAGKEVWIDRWKITGREPYWDEIQQGIEGCAYFIFLVSPDSIDRASGSRKELYHVASLKPTPMLVPVMVRSTPYHDFPIVITPGEYQIHDFVNEAYEAAFPDLLVSLSQQGSTAQFRTSDQPTPAPVPSVPAGSASSARRLPLAIGLVVVLAVVAAGSLIILRQSNQTNRGTSTATITADSSTQAPASAQPVTALPTQTPPPPGPTPVICSGFLPPRLTTGAQGRVTPGKPNRLRSLPDSTSNLIGLIPAGTVFDVVRGPQCGQDGAWWLITYSGGTGWTVEGDAYSYYLEPVSAGSGNAPVVADAGTLAVDGTAPATESAVPPGASPTAKGGGGGKIAYTVKVGAKFQIFLANADGSNAANITNTTSNEYSPSWSPDGKHLVFVSDRDSRPQIYIMDADGKNPRHVAITSANDSFPAWSPNGHDIAFTSDEGGNTNIYVIDQSGQPLRQLTFDKADDYSPAWSPDGKRIAFVSNRTGGAEIYVMDSNSDHLARLTTSPNANVANMTPVWSPDGTQIAFVSNRDGVHAIYVLGITDNNVQRLTTEEHNEEMPVWSPDEAWILFVSDQGQGLALSIMDLNGQNVHRLVDNVANFAPSWQPTE